MSHSLAWPLLPVLRMECKFGIISCLSQVGNFDPHLALDHDHDHERLRARVNIQREREGDQGFFETHKKTRVEGDYIEREGDQGFIERFDYIF